MDENSDISSSSATNSPIRLSEYLPHLLQFTLSLLVEGVADLPSSLPPEFCAQLLKNEPHNVCICTPSHGSNTCNCICHGNAIEAAEEGVPVYPLYKQLACAFYVPITSGTFIRKNATIPGLNEDEALMLKMDEWMKMIVNMGCHLIDVLQSAKFHLDVQEPYFTQLRIGQKSIEGRCAVGNYKRYLMLLPFSDLLLLALATSHIFCKSRFLPGDLLLVNRCLLLTVQAVNWYNSFYEMIEAEGIEKVLPGIKTVEEGIEVYRRFYTKERENIGGVFAIIVSRASIQPYIIISDMLCKLNVEGVKFFLGLRSTTGTLPTAVSPPRSILISSFSAFNRENV